MPKMRFGCYFIPEPGEFYRTGSAITGYDIRARQELPAPPYIRPEWQTTMAEYGFHVTITDAIDIASNLLPLISDRVRQILSCFNTTNRYVLTKSRIGFWDRHRADAAIVLTPNRSVEILHDVLVSVLHPLGEGSAYYDAYKDHPAACSAHSPASRSAKTEQFYAPYIFDEFIPHFTCVNPFTGTQAERQEVERSLVAQFASFTRIEFERLCLVAKAHDEPHYKIIEEFNLHT